MINRFKGKRDPAQVFSRIDYTSNFKNNSEIQPFDKGLLKSESRQSTKDSFYF